MKVLHSWLKDYIGASMPDVPSVERLLTFHAFEIDGIEEERGETVIDVKVLPDRAGDSLSHRGIARELAVHIGSPLEHDPFRDTPALPPRTQALSIHIQEAARCRRYMAALVRGVRVSGSPVWLRDRLEALGHRSINNVVDATNYVMLALGQPLHAYDAAKLEVRDERYALSVRMAKAEERITTLSGEDRTLTEAVPVIADGCSDTVLGIAGVKGGVHAQISETTTDLILEAANFDPQLTRKAAQALRLPTDAAKRFENNLSPEVAPYALAELIRIVIEVAGGSAEGYADIYPEPRPNPVVAVTLADLNARLGLALTAEVVGGILARLGLTIQEEEEGMWQVQAPFERRDIRISEDVIEEVGRVYGYEHVSSVIPPAVPLPEVNPYHYYSERIRNLLCDAGFSEIITSSFRSKDEIELQNALASDKGCLRSELRANLLEALDRNMPNADLLGVSRIQIFEIGTVFHKTEEGTDVTEHISLALAVRTKQQGYSPKDDTRLEEVVSLLEAALSAPLNARIEKGVLECDLSALVASLPAPHAYDPYTPGETVTFKPYSAYPFVSRDIALWVPERTTAEDVEGLIREHAGPLLLFVRLFDTFAKDGRISYAFRLIFQSFERTLTDTEVGEATERITAALAAKGFEVR